MFASQIVVVITTSFKFYKLCSLLKSNTRFFEDFSYGKAIVRGRPVSTGRPFFMPLLLVQPAFEIFY